MSSRHDDRWDCHPAGCLCHSCRSAINDTDSIHNDERTGRRRLERARPSDALFDGDRA